MCVESRRDEQFSVVIYSRLILMSFLLFLFDKNIFVGLLLSAFKFSCHCFVFIFLSFSFSH